MLRFQINDQAQRPHTYKKRRHRKRSKEHGSKHNYVDVNVGTPRLLRVSLDNAIDYEYLHEGNRSTLIRTKIEGQDDEIVVIRWADSSSGCEDKDDKVMSLVPDKSIVPLYKAKQRFVHQGRYVPVGIRRYIHGEVLGDVIRKCTPEQLDHYKLQISAIASNLAGVTSGHYGAVLNGGLKATTVHGYLSACSVIEKLRNPQYLNVTVPAAEDNWNPDCIPKAMPRSVMARPHHREWCFSRGYSGLV